MAQRTQPANADTRRRDRAKRVIRSTRAKSEQAEQQLDIEDVLNSYDETFLECRDLRHAWRRIGYWNEGWRVVKLLQCQRCPTTRRISMRANGAIIDSKYEYPDGYQIKGAGMGGVPGDKLRVEAMKRARVWASENEMMEALKKPRARRKAG